LKLLYDDLKRIEKQILENVRAALRGGRVAPSVEMLTYENPDAVEIRLNTVKENILCLASWPWGPEIQLDMVQGNTLHYAAGMFTIKGDAGLGRLLFLPGKVGANIQELGAKYLAEVEHR